ncbi:MAG: MATE family efflux transporter, partial [Dysosmobacter sp.]|nr:MATE family efflux transporter [Dysosmobacter sp.]
MGIAPIIGFNYGNRNDVQLKRVFAISMRFIGLASVLVFAVSMFGGSYIVRLFTDHTSEVYLIAANGFTIFSYSFLFCGLNNFTSAMFTALSNGKLSAALSFLRTFGLLSGGILLLPRIWGIAGVWLAVPFAEGIMFIVSAACLVHERKRYAY